MAHRFVRLLSLFVFIFLGFEQLSAAAIEGVREVNLSLKGLVYDPFTQKLYGSATNDLLQIDPESGQVLARFPLGTNVTALSLGADNGLWTAIRGEHAVRRFNLQTLEAEEKIEYDWDNAPTFDIAASKLDPQTVVFSTDPTPKILGAALVVRDGLVLPDYYLQADYLQLEGNILFVGKIGKITRGLDGFQDGLAKVLSVLG